MHGLGIILEIALINIYLINLHCVVWELEWRIFADNVPLEIACSSHVKAVLSGWHVAIRTVI